MYLADKGASNMNRRTAPWSWIAIVVALGLVAKHPYRMFVHEQAIRDFGLSNVLPSFFTIVFFVLVLSRWRMATFWMFAGLLLGSLSYELSQAEYFRDALPAFYSADQVFDPWDILACIVGWLVAVGLVYFRRNGRPSTSEYVPEQSSPAEAREASRC